MNSSEETQLRDDLRRIVQTGAPARIWMRSSGAGAVSSGAPSRSAAWRSRASSG